MEEKDKVIKVLLICSGFRGYHDQLWNNIIIRHSNIQYSILVGDDYYDAAKEAFDLRYGGKIYTFHADFYNKRGILNRTINHYKRLKEAVEKLPEFDIIHFLWIEEWFGFVAGSVMKKTDRLFLSIGGSDLYRKSRNPVFRFLQKRLIKRASYFSAENNETAEYFYKVYGQRYRKFPMSINNFGVDILDAVDAYEEKEFKSVFKEKIVIACGHNASVAHQHKKMIDCIINLSDVIKKKCRFVYPMTYGESSEGYIDDIESLLDDNGLDYDILREYMNNFQMAEYIKGCDIMIHVQTSDQLSSTMLAHMYCGNVVIAGSWLPYNSLREKGIYFISIDSIDDLKDTLEEVINNLDEYKAKCVGNREKVYELSSWDSCEKKWYDSYCAIMNNKA